MQLKSIVQEVNIPMLFISGAFAPMKVTEHFFLVGDSKITVDREHLGPFVSSKYKISQKVNIINISVYILHFVISCKYMFVLLILKSKYELRSSYPMSYLTCIRETNRGIIKHLI